MDTTESLTYYINYLKEGLGDCPRHLAPGVAYWRRDPVAFLRPPRRSVLRRSWSWLQARRKLLFNRAFSHSLSTWRLVDGWLRATGRTDWTRFDPYEMYKPEAQIDKGVPGGLIPVFGRTGNRLLLVDDLARARASYGRWHNRIRAMDRQDWVLLTTTSRARRGDSVRDSIDKAAEAIRLVKASGLYAGWFQSMELDFKGRSDGGKSWRCHSHHLALLKPEAKPRDAAAWGKGLEILTRNDYSARSVLPISGADGLRETSKYCFKALGDSSALTRPWDVAEQFDAVKGRRLSETWGICRGKGLEPPDYPLSW